MKLWFEAARPRTLPAAVAPVLVGTAAARTVTPWRAAAALVVSLSLQVAVNFANDLFDAERGVDSERRVGPRRMVSSGLMTASQMRRGIATALGVAVLAGLALTSAVGPELLAVGALCIVAALGYSGGPRPYASAGLGEVFVFVFFGLVATAGSTYVQIERVPARAWVGGTALGCLAAAILMVNNLRDVATDSAAEKRTVAVQLGPRRTRAAFRVLVITPFLLLGPLAALERSPAPLLALGAAALALRPLRGVSEDGPSLIPVLAATALLELAFAVLLAVALWIS